MQMAKKRLEVECLLANIGRSAAQGSSSHRSVQTITKWFWLLETAIFVLVLASLAGQTAAEFQNGLPVEENTHGIVGPVTGRRDMEQRQLQSLFAHDVFLGEALLGSVNDQPAVSMIQAAPDTHGGAPAPNPARGATLLPGVKLAINFTSIQGTKVTQVVAFKDGAAAAVFNLTTTTAEKEQLLLDIGKIAENPEARFDLTWTPTSATSGNLNLRLESTYNASASKPTIAFTLNFKHVVGRTERSETVTASVPKEDIFQFKSVPELKAWLAANTHPPLLKHSDSFQIVSMKLGGSEKQKQKQKNEIKGEEGALQWLQKIAALKEPILSVSGDLERNAIVEIPYFDNLTWPNMLQLRLLVEEAAKTNTPLSSLLANVPGLKAERFSVSPAWFSLTPEQQYEFWLKGKQPGATGILPGQLNTAGLFGPQYGGKSPSILFVDHKGQPFGTNKKGSNSSLFGTRLTPVDKVPDYLTGQFAPAINAKIVFPGGTSANHVLNPLREWHKIEKHYGELRAALAPKEREKNAAILSVTVNGNTYPLVAEFVEQHPTLLHLLAKLAAADPNFVLNDVTLTFGANQPRAVKAMFILETPEGVPPWCIFSYDVPITKRNTIVIKTLLKNARRYAESPQGCNITNVKGLRFETITAVAGITQLQPTLQIENRQQLNFKGSSAECKRLGSIFSEAYKRQQQLAMFFRATHLLKASVDIPRYKKDGTELKPQVKTTTQRVHMNEDFPHLLLDFQKPFAKYKVPGVEFPYVQVKGGPPRSAMPHGTLPEAWYHQPPGAKLAFHPQFPVLGDRDIFIDGQGPHPAGGELNIPLHPGTQAFSLPFSVIQRWLRQHIPNLQLPVDLEHMPAEDRASLFSKIIIEVEGGEKMKLIDILKPLIRSPQWKSIKPADFQLPYHLLQLPIKNMFVEGGMNFVITTPDGGQKSYTLPIRPEESWDTVANRFFHDFPQHDRETTKLSLFDNLGNPIQLNPQAHVYAEVKEAVQQRRKGLQVSLETPAGKFTACYRQEEGTNKCLVVSMHTVFCGKIKGISERAERWETQCNAADMRSRSMEEMQQFMESTLRGPEIVRPVRLRDLLAIIRKHIAAVRPDLIAQLNLPDPATSQAEIANLKAQVDSLRAKAQKKAEDYDAIQGLRRQIKLIQSKETKWASAASLTFFHIKEKGVEKDLTVSLGNHNLRLADDFWKVYHTATRLSPEAAMLDFANVYEIHFRVLGMEERQEEKKRMKQQTKEQKQAEKVVTQVKVKVNVSFVVDNDEVFSDSGIDIMLPSDYVTGLTIGGKRKVAAQISKLYRIPKNYFTFNDYPRVVSDPNKGDTPTLKIALQAACSNNNGTVGVKPADLARVLSEQGGYAQKDLIFLTTTSGQQFKVAIDKLPQIKPDKIHMYKFGWKKKVSDISSEAQEKAKAKQQAEAGEKTLLFSVNVGDPTKWKELLAPWLSRLRGFGELTDTKIQFVVRPDTDPNRSTKKSKCKINTFGELLEYVNDMEKLLQKCPGLKEATTTRRPFAFDLGIRSPPPINIRLWNRAHGDSIKNSRYLDRLTDAFSRVQDDTKIQWKFSKHNGTMTPQQISAIKKLLQSNAPRDAALVRSILTALQVPEDDIARLTGRLGISITHEPTPEDSVLLREGVVTMDIARSNGPRAFAKISARGNPDTIVAIDVPEGEYAMSYSLYSPTKQVTGSPCSIRTASDFRNLTWAKVLEWCGLTFQELGGLSAPFLWVEGVQTAMYPRTQPGEPIVSYQNGSPIGYTFRREGAPASDIMSNDVYFNLLMQPGKNVPGGMFIQRSPTPTGGIDTNFNYYGQDPTRWPAAFEPGTNIFPKGTTGEFNIYPDAEQEDRGNSFTSPFNKAFEIPGFSHLPDMKESINLIFNPKMPPPPGGEVVYVQAPAGNGRYYYCQGITISQLLNMRKEEAARVCGIPPEFLDGDVLVNTFSPVIIYDRLGRPHYNTASWEDSPLRYLETVLQGGHPADQVVFTFANTNRCVVTRHTLKNLKTWTELGRFCSVTFEGVRPTAIVGAVQPVYSVPPVQISMPESMKTTFINKHNGNPPEKIFSMEPLGLVISNLLGGQPPGFTIEAFLEMNDGRKLNFTQIPEEWKNIPGPQILGLKGITIKPIQKPQGHFGDTNMGTMQDLLQQLNIGGQTPFSEFVTKVTGDGNSPRGIQIPSANITIGGPTPPGTPRPVLDFEMLQPETVGSSGIPDYFGVRVPLAHGSVPETMPMSDVVKMLHNPQITVHQKPQPTYSMTALAGSNVPFTKKTDRLDTSFQDVVEFFKNSLGIDNTEGIHITTVVDGNTYRATLSAEQLLGHTIASILHLCGAEDFGDSHDVVFIGQLAPGFQAKKVPSNRHMNFVVNGTIYEDKPGTPMDFAKVLNINVPGKGQAPTDFKFNIRGPGGSSVTQMVPGEMMQLLQEVADMHGHPGMSLVLSFLNALKQVSSIAPGQTLEIDTQSLEAPEFKHPKSAIEDILNTPAEMIPTGSYLVAFTGQGAQVKKITRPITPLDKGKTVKKLLQHLNIALNSITDLKLVAHPREDIAVEDGSMDFGLLGQTVQVPLRYLSRTDTRSINDLLQDMGKRLSTLLANANLPRQKAILHTVFIRRDGSRFSVDTPLGFTEEVEQVLRNLTLWSLVPEEAEHQHIKHVSMSVQLGATAQAASDQTPTGATQQQPQAALMTPREQTWGTLPGTPASRVPNFFIQAPNGSKILLDTIKEKTVRLFLRSTLAPNPQGWHRAFWGTQTPEGGCSPKTEFPYYMVMSTKLGDLPVPQDRDCLAILLLDQKFQTLLPSVNPKGLEAVCLPRSGHPLIPLKTKLVGSCFLVFWTVSNVDSNRDNRALKFTTVHANVCAASVPCKDFEVAFLFHEPPLQASMQNGRNIYHAHSMELAAVKKPLRELIQKAIGWRAVSSIRTCLITEPNIPFGCDDPLLVDLDSSSLESIASVSRYVLAGLKPTQNAPSFAQRGSFLARINRVNNLRQSRN